MHNSKKTLEPSDLKRQVQSAIKMAFQITFLFLGGVLLMACTYLYLAFLEIYFG
jgi:cell division septal protein FtsQ